MYADGRGVPQDDREAVAWYRKAADQGHANAQNNLGVRYDNGRGVPQDDREAVAWYRKAADQGHALAQYNLGLMYANGEGVPQDDREAVVWYRKAADQGHADAQNNLGVMYVNGEGVERNFSWAVYYQAQAARAGHTLAPGNIERNLPKLTRKRVRPSDSNVRAGSSTQHQVITTAPRGTEVFILGTVDDWHVVYLRTGHTVGWMAASVLEDIVTAAPAPRPQATGEFPPAPAPRPGLITCNTRCLNGDCFRTYSDGRQVRFQAPHKYNPMSGQWEWDSGGC